MNRDHVQRVVGLAGMCDVGLNHAIVILMMMMMMSLSAAGVCDDPQWQQRPGAPGGH